MFRWLILFLLVWLAAPAEAAVRLDFYARDTDRRFPHAYVILTGTVDATGEAVAASFGFTAASISPRLLMGPVDGRVLTRPPADTSEDDLRFSLILTDEEYALVLAVVEQWRSLPQPSYDLDTRTCVTFIAAIAAAVGLRTPDEPRLARRPASFLLAVADLNAARLAAPAEAQPAELALAD